METPAQSDEGWKGLEGDGVAMPRIDETLVANGNCQILSPSRHSPTAMAENIASAVGKGQAESDETWPSSVVAAGKEGDESSAGNENDKLDETGAPSDSASTGNEKLGETETPSDSASTGNEKLGGTETPSDNASSSSTGNKKLDETEAPCDSASTGNEKLGGTETPSDSASTGNEKPGETETSSDNASSSSTGNEKLGETETPSDSASTGNEKLGETETPSDNASSSSTGNEKLGEPETPSDSVSGSSTGNEKLDETETPSDSAFTGNENLGETETPSDSAPTGNEKLGETETSSDNASSSSTGNEKLGETETPPDSSSGSSTGNEKLDETETPSDSAFTGNENLGETETPSDSAFTGNEKLGETETPSDSASTGNEKLGKTETPSDGASTGNRKLGEIETPSDSASTGNEEFGETEAPIDNENLRGSKAPVENEKLFETEMPSGSSGHENVGETDTPGKNENVRETDSPVENENLDETESRVQNENVGEINTPGENEDEGETDTPVENENLDETESRVENENLGKIHTPGENENVGETNTPVEKENLGETETPSVFGGKEKLDEHQTADVTAERAGPPAEEEELVCEGAEQVQSADVPEVSSADVPEVSSADVPEVSIADVPEVSRADVPEVSSADVPEVSSADVPEVSSADVPEVSSVDVPEVSNVDVPEDSSVDVVEVSSADVAGVPSDEVEEVPSVDVAEVQSAGIPSAEVSEVPSADVAGVQSPEVLSADVAEVLSADVAEVQSPEVSSADVAEVESAEFQSTDVAEIPSADVAEVQSPEVSSADLAEVESAEFSSADLAEASSPDVAHVESAELTSVPGADMGGVSSTYMIDVPSIEKDANRPSANLAEVKNPEVAEVPNAEVAEVPGTEMAEVPSAELAEIPSAELAEVPNDEFAEVPSAEMAEISSAKLAEVPSAKLAEVPSDELAGVSSELVEVPSAKLAEVPSDELAEVSSANMEEAVPCADVQTKSTEVAKVPSDEVTDAQRAELEDVANIEVAEVLSTKVPEVSHAEVPEISSTEVSEVPSAEVSEVPSAEVSAVPSTEVSETQSVEYPSASIEVPCAEVADDLKNTQFLENSESSVDETVDADSGKLSEHEENVDKEKVMEETSSAVMVNEKLKSTDIGVGQVIGTRNDKCEPDAAALTDGEHEELVRLSPSGTQSANQTAGIRQADDGVIRPDVKEDSVRSGVDEEQLEDIPAKDDTDVPATMHEGVGIESVNVQSREELEDMPVKDDTDVETAQNEDVSSQSVNVESGNNDGKHLEEDITKKDTVVQIAQNEEIGMEDVGIEASPTDTGPCDVGCDSTRNLVGKEENKSPVTEPVSNHEHEHSTSPVFTQEEKDKVPEQSAGNLLVNPDLGLDLKSSERVKDIEVCSVNATMEGSWQHKNRSTVKSGKESSYTESASTEKDNIKISASVPVDTAAASSQQTENTLRTKQPSFGGQSKSVSSQSSRARDSNRQLPQRKSVSDEKCDNIFEKFSSAESLQASGVAVPKDLRRTSDDCVEKSSHSQFKFFNSSDYRKYKPTHRTREIREDEEDESAVKENRTDDQVKLGQSEVYEGGEKQEDKRDTEIGNATQEKDSPMRTGDGTSSQKDPQQQDLDEKDSSHKRTRLLGNRKSKDEIEKKADKSDDGAGRNSQQAKTTKSEESIKGTKTDAGRHTEPDLDKDIDRAAAEDSDKIASCKKQGSVSRNGNPVNEKREPRLFEDDDHLSPDNQSEVCDDDHSDKTGRGDGVRQTSTIEEEEDSVDKEDNRDRRKGEKSVPGNGANQVSATNAQLTFSRTKTVKTYTRKSESDRGSHKISKTSNAVTSKAQPSLDTKVKGSVKTVSKNSLCVVTGSNTSKNNNLESSVTESQKPSFVGKGRKRKREDETESEELKMKPGRTREEKTKSDGRDEKIISGNTKADRKSKLRDTNSVKPITISTRPSRNTDRDSASARPSIVSRITKALTSSSRIGKRTALLALSSITLGKERRSSSSSLRNTDKNRSGRPNSLRGEKRKAVLVSGTEGSASKKKRRSAAATEMKKDDGDGEGVPDGGGAGGHGAEGKTGSHTCSICSREYQTPYRLQRHMTHHKAGKHFCCEVCGKAFDTQEKLDIHQEVHQQSVNGVFTCAHCGRKCKNWRSYIYHINTHSADGGKKYACDLCGHTMSSIHRLERHNMHHSRGHHFCCFTCGKLFLDQEGLNKHLASHSGRLSSSSSTTITPISSSTCTSMSSTSSPLVNTTPKFSLKVLGLKPVSKPRQVPPCEEDDNVAEKTVHRDDDDGGDGDQPHLPKQPAVLRATRRQVEDASWPPVRKKAKMVKDDPDVTSPGRGGQSTSGDAEKQRLRKDKVTDQKLSLVLPSLSQDSGEVRKSSRKRSHSRKRCSCCRSSPPSEKYRKIDSYKKLGKERKSWSDNEKDTKVLSPCPRASEQMVGEEFTESATAGEKNLDIMQGDIVMKECTVKLERSPSASVQKVSPDSFRKNPAPPSHKPFPTLAEINQVGAEEGRKSATDKQRRPAASDHFGGRKIRISRTASEKLLPKNLALSNPSKERARRAAKEKEEKAARAEEEEEAAISKKKKKKRHSNPISADENTSSNKPHTCDICKKTFLSSSDLKIHIGKHLTSPTRRDSMDIESVARSCRLASVCGSPDKPVYQCTRCGYNARAYADLTKHMWLHSPKPFQCTECCAAFSLATTLQQHMKAHPKSRAQQAGQGK